MQSLEKSKIISVRIEINIIKRCGTACLVFAPACGPLSTVSPYVMFRRRHSRYRPAGEGVAGPDGGFESHKDVIVYPIRGDHLIIV